MNLVSVIFRVNDQGLVVLVAELADLEVVFLAGDGRLVFKVLYQIQCYRWVRLKLNYFLLVSVNQESVRLKAAHGCQFNQLF